MFVLTALMAVLLVLATIPTSTAHAVSDQATWDNGSITYQGNTYSGPADDQTVAALKLLKGTQVYTYIDSAPASTTTGTTTTGPPQKMHVIFFASDVDVKTASRAKYLTYTYVSISSFKDPTDPVDIAIDPQQAGTTSASSGSSCQVDGGIGWIVCPISNFIAKGMDTVFNVLTGFLQVQPLQTGQDTPLLRGWEYMRSIANVAFVIAFLMIIYSQVTGVGVSAYGLRKLLPRLIIAAILVNVSYFICSIAVDISNILGYSIQDIFMNIRNSLVGSNNGWSNTMSWSSITGFILAGGTATAAGSIALVTTLSSFGVGGSVILLLPALVSGLLAVLVALVVLAARQAIIVVLTLIAPLAFVAYLLPNTEKWFEKWRSLFMNMLIIFPAFSILFGGSQLAGDAIIQTATSINMIVLGMLVKVAPLFITPFLMRFSGSMLSNIGKMIQGRGSKIVGSTRNFAKDRAENQRVRRLAIDNPSRRQFLVRNAQRRDHNRRRREGWRNANGAMVDARWANSLDYSDIDQRSRLAGDRKTLGENTSNLRYNQAKTTDAAIRQLDTSIRHAKLEVENAELQANLNWEQNHNPLVTTTRLNHESLEKQIEAAKAIHAQDFEELLGRPDVADLPAGYRHIAAAARREQAIAKAALRDLRVASAAKGAATGQQDINFANELKDSEALARRAAGISGINKDTGVIPDSGILHVRASAEAILERARLEGVKAVKETSAAIDPTKIVDLMREAVVKHDTVAIEAYMEILASKKAFGQDMLRKQIDYIQDGLSDDELIEVRTHAGTIGDLMGGGADLANWTFDAQKRHIVDIASDISVWQKVKPSAFIKMNTGSQNTAIDSGAIDQAMATEILEKDVNGDLDNEIRKRIKEISETGTTAKFYDYPEKPYRP